MKDKPKIHELDAIQNWEPLPYVLYRGVVVWKNLKTGFYELWGRTGLDADGVDRVIDNSLMALGKSIGSND